MKEAEQAYHQFELALYARKIELADSVAREVGDPNKFGTIKLKEVLKERFPKIRFDKGILEAACKRCRYEK